MEKQYEPLRKKYKLPAFKDISIEFELDNIESKYILLEIRRKIGEKVNTYAKFLEELLQPDTTPSSLYECTVLNSDLEKRKVFDTYRKIMIIERSNLLVSLKSAEKEDAAFIKETYIKWLKLKPELVKIIELVKTAWDQEIDTKFHVEYLG